VRAALEAKVRVLQEWGHNGIPEGAVIPRTLIELRKWRGPNGDLDTWEDPKIGSTAPSGKHHDLAEDFQNALTEIDARFADSFKDLLDKALAENALLNKQIRRLALQNSSLIARIDALEKDARLARTLTTIAR
jgi:hypothetical protein